MPWSNPFDPQNPLNTNWQIWSQGVWQPVPANSPINYPGKTPGIFDTVQFDTGRVFADCNLDVALANPLFSLQFTGWAGTLTLSQNLTIANGSLLMADNATISLNANKTFTLAGNTVGTWIGGDIIGAAGSIFQVNGALTTDPGIIAPVSTPVGLGTDMVVGGSFTLVHMGNNLALTAADNVIDVQNGGTLSLSQHIVNQGDQNSFGGIVLAGTHTGPHAVQIWTGGTLVRPNVGGSQNGVPDQVSIGGTVFNAGGTVNVGQGEMLNVTGKDANNYSYWQLDDPAATLYLESGANLSVAGTYQIDRGQVRLTAPSGGSADELDSVLGLNFGNVNPTFLTVVDSISRTTGSVTIQGPVNLADNTTTTLSYKGGATSTADLLDVKNGALKLAGTLQLNRIGTAVPTIPLDFLDDSGPGPAINGNFGSITGNVAGAVYTPNTVVNNPQLIYFVVRIT